VDDVLEGEVVPALTAAPPQVGALAPQSEASAGTDGADAGTGGAVGDSAAAWVRYDTGEMDTRLGGGDVSGILVVRVIRGTNLEDKDRCARCTCVCVCGGVPAF
jgi:hypothetical protein